MTDYHLWARSHTDPETNQTWVTLEDSDEFKLELTLEAYDAFLIGGGAAIHALVGLLKENMPEEDQWGL